MKTGKWLIWVTALLLVMNISAVLTMVYHKKQETRTENSLKSVANESEASVRYSGRWFRDELGLTKEQMNEFARFNPPFRQKIRSINIELNNLKMSMLDEMDSDDSDTARLNLLSDSIGMLHAELKKVTYNYYLEFRRIVNPEQKEKLRQIFSGMFEGAIPAGPGRGMQGGKRFGMRRVNS